MLHSTHCITEEQPKFVNNFIRIFDVDHKRLLIKWHGINLKPDSYVIVVTWAQGICLICMPKARGLRAYISGKSREHILQVICVTSESGFC